VTPGRWLLVTERVYVGDVLRSPGGALVLDERAPADHRYLVALEIEAFTIRNGFGKCNFRRRD
jgi:hypothetical protein